MRLERPSREESRGPRHGPWEPGLVGWGTGLGESVLCNPQAEKKLHRGGRAGVARPPSADGWRLRRAFWPPIDG